MQNKNDVFECNYCNKLFYKDNKKICDICDKNYCLDCFQICFYCSNEFACYECYYSNDEYVDICENCSKHKTNFVY